MHLLDQRLLGILILCLLALLVGVKRAATGSVLDKPQGRFMVQLVNVFNLFFLLVVNPAAAVVLLTRRVESIDPTHITIGTPWRRTLVEILGLVMYAGGFLLMAWALAMLSRNYQLGGSTPRSDDRMVTGGPYRMIRHPMYTAALSIALGLALMIQSWAVLCVFAIYLVLILRLIPLEEEGLRQAYGEWYATYRERSKGLIPFVY